MTEAELDGGVGDAAGEALLLGLELLDLAADAGDLLLDLEDVGDGAGAVGEDVLKAGFGDAVVVEAGCEVLVFGGDVFTGLGFLGDFAQGAKIGERGVEVFGGDSQFCGQDDALCGFEAFHEAAVLAHGLLHRNAGHSEVCDFEIEIDAAGDHLKWRRSNGHLGGDGRVVVVGDCHASVGHGAGFGWQGDRGRRRRGSCRRRVGEG